MLAVIKPTEVDYAQHRSVYDNPQVEEKPAEEEKQESTKGSMPKGWKPE